MHHPQVETTYRTSPRGDAAVAKERSWNRGGSREERSRNWGGSAEERTRNDGVSPDGRPLNRGASPDRTSQIYIGTPNGIVLCAERGDEGAKKTGGSALRGRFYHAYSREPVIFNNPDQLLFEMESFFDSINFPHPSTAMRSFADMDRGGYRREGRKERKMKDSELLEKHGDMGSFIIRVQHRQNSSMQGRLTWMEKNKTVYFRSLWEMVRLIDSAIEMENPVPEEELPSWDD